MTRTRRISRSGRSSRTSGGINCWPGTRGYRPASPAAEEVLASLLGAIVVGEGPDRDALVAKATAEVLAGADGPEAAVRLVAELWEQLGGLLS